MKAKIGTERNRISPGVSGVHGEAQLDVYLRDQVVRLRPIRRKDAFSEEKKIDLHDTHPYRLASTLLNYRTLALVVDRWCICVRYCQGPTSLPGDQNITYGCA